MRVRNNNYRFLIAPDIDIDTPLRHCCCCCRSSTFHIYGPPISLDTPLIDPHDHGARQDAARPIPLCLARAALHGLLLHARARAHAPSLPPHVRALELRSATPRPFRAAPAPDLPPALFASHYAGRAIARDVRRVPSFRC